MFTIDIHTHILPEHIPDFKAKFGYEGFINLDHHKPCCARLMMDNEFFREVQDNCWSPEVRIKECDKHGVNVQVLSTLPVMFSYWAKPKDTLELAMFLNDHIAGIVELYPKRYIGLGTLPMQSPDLAINELERCKAIGLKGIQIGSHINDWNLDAPELFPVFEAMQNSNMALFVHPWWWMAKAKMPNYWLPWLVGMPAETSLAICSMIFGGVFRRLPSLRVAFAHGGGAFPGTIGRIEHGFKARPELFEPHNTTNPKEYLGKFYLDSLVHDEKMLDYIIDLVGPNRIALGSDYPFPLGETEPGKLIHSRPYNNTIKELLLHGAALDWLGLGKEEFI